MKVKRQREDFIVREISHFATQAAGQRGGGGHAVYHLQKSGLGTPEAASEILSIWNLPRRNLSYGGLKDRHALTSQTITIFGGPAENIEQPGFTLTYLGQSPREFTPQDIECNEFDVTLRELTPQRSARLVGTLQGTQWAIPNYFDDQRFGSLGESGRFVAQPWCLGDYEQALFLAIAEANPHDRSEDRAQKEILRTYWGDWNTCKERLERSHRRSIVTYLVDHPSGFKKAVALIRKDLRGIYVAAFQAKIWNEIVSRKLSRSVPADQLIVQHATGGQWVFPKQLPAELLAELRNCRIPLPSGRQTQWPPGIPEILDEVLSEFGIERHKLRFSHPRDVFFARGLRDMLLVPRLSIVEEGSDEYGAEGTRKLRLCFQLAPGQYATMLIKGLDMLAHA